MSFNGSVFNSEYFDHDNKRCCNIAHPNNPIVAIVIVPP